MSPQNIHISPAGDLLENDQQIGLVQGLQFTPLSSTTGEPPALTEAMRAILDQEFDRRLTRIREAVNESFVLSREGLIRWLGEPLAKIVTGAHLRQPDILLLADPSLDETRTLDAQQRLRTWLTQHVETAFAPLSQLDAATALDPPAQTIAKKIVENFGILERARLASTVRALSPESRSQLRGLGVRFGVHHLYLPVLLKPAARTLAVQLWALSQPTGLEGTPGLEEILPIIAGGRTSTLSNPDLPVELYKMAGLRVCGERVIRVDIIERLLDIIRPAQTFRVGETPGNAPPGAAEGDEFTITPDMLSLIGCTLPQLGSILASLNYVSREPTPSQEAPVDSETKPEADVETDPVVETPTEPPAEAVATPESEAPEGETHEGDETPSLPKKAKDKEIDAKKQAFLSLLWRYQHPPRPQRSKHKHHQEKTSSFQKREGQETQKPQTESSETRPSHARRKGAPHQKHPGQHQRPHHKPPPKEEPLNMDSPFAKLLQLKEEYQNRSK